MATGNNQHINGFALEALTAPQTSFSGYYFPWNNYLKAFDTTSYKPEYSDGRISCQDIEFLMRDINSIEGINLRKCDNLAWLMCAVLPILLIGIPSAISQLTRRPPNVPGYLILLFGSIFLSICLVTIIGVKLNKRQKEREFKRNQSISAVLSRHQSTTFAGKDSVLRVSTHGSFIAIEFRFRLNGQQGGFQAQPQFTNYNQPSYGAPQNNPFENPSDYRSAPRF